MIRHCLIGLGVLLAACFSTGRAGAAAASDSVAITAPAPPLLSTIAGGSIPPHSDYVRVTYVTLRGETLASDESVLSQPGNALTVVRSPIAALGAVGYNVYAIANNGGNRAGHTLQNRSPIPMGTDYTEPVTGWTAGGAAAPATSAISVRLPWVEAAYQITPSGGYFDASVLGGVRGALLLPHSDAPAGTTLHLSTIPGLPSGVPGPRAGTDAGSAPVVVETIRFAFSRDVTLSAYPTFKFAFPGASQDAAPTCYLQLYDGRTHALLATVPGFAYGKLAFLSDYGAPFKALRDRPYYAELVSRFPEAIEFGAANISAPIPLPNVGGITGSVVLPSGEFGGAFYVSVLAAQSPPIGLPLLSGPDVRRPLYYASVVVAGTASLSKPATLTVRLPASLAASGRDYAIAAFDSGFARNGWFTGIRPTKVDGNTLTFTAMLPGFMAWRQYGVALYESGTVRSPAQTSKLRSPAQPTVVIVGDSISLLTIVKPSGAGCSPGWGPLPECQYSNDPAQTWPGVLAQLTGYRVINLSALGVSTIKNEYTGPSMLELMVPQIPRDAQFVVCQCGINDLSLHDQSPATSANAAILTDAIHARAPHARIVFIGLRCWTACGKPGIDAWNEALRGLAETYGAFVDLIPIAPDGASAAFPDGSHPNPSTARLIASKVAAVLLNWRPNGPRH